MEQQTAVDQEQRQTAVISGSGEQEMVSYSARDAGHLTQSQQPPASNMSYPNADSVQNNDSLLVMAHSHHNDESMGSAGGTSSGGDSSESGGLHHLHMDESMPGGAVGGIPSSLAMEGDEVNNTSNSNNNNNNDEDDPEDDPNAKRYKCEYCSKSYIREFQLNTHMRRYHPEQLKSPDPVKGAWSQEDMDEALDALKNERMTLVKTSAHYNIPASTLWQRANKLGIMMPKNVTRTSSKDGIADAVQLLKTGQISVNKASKVFGIPPSTLYKIAKREGIQLSSPFNSGSTSWTQEHLQLAMDAIRAGQMSVHMASVEYKIPPGTLYGRCKREGLELSRTNPVQWSPRDLKNALEAVKTGQMSINQASEHFKISYSSLYKRVKPHIANNNNNNINISNSNNNNGNHHLHHHGMMLGNEHETEAIMTNNQIISDGSEYDTRQQQHQHHQPHLMHQQHLLPQHHHQQQQSQSLSPHLGHHQLQQQQQQQHNFYGQPQLHSPPMHHFNAGQQQPVIQRVVHHQQPPQPHHHNQQQQQHHQQTSSGQQPLNHPHPHQMHQASPIINTIDPLNENHHQHHQQQQQALHLQQQQQSSAHQNHHPGLPQQHHIHNEGTAPTNGGHLQLQGGVADDRGYSGIIGNEGDVDKHELTSSSGIGLNGLMGISMGFLDFAPEPPAPVAVPVTEHNYNNPPASHHHYSVITKDNSGAAARGGHSTVHHHSNSSIGSNNNNNGHHNQHPHLSQPPIHHHHNHPQLQQQQHHHHQNVHNSNTINNGSSSHCTSNTTSSGGSSNSNSPNNNNNINHNNNGYATLRPLDALPVESNQNYYQQHAANMYVQQQHQQNATDPLIMCEDKMVERSKERYLIGDGGSHEQDDKVIVTTINDL